VTVQIIKLLIMPSLISLFRCLGCTKELVQARGLLFDCFATGYVFTARSF